MSISSLLHTVVQKMMQKLQDNVKLKLLFGKINLQMIWGFFSRDEWVHIIDACIASTCMMAAVKVAPL